MKHRFISALAFSFAPFVYAPSAHADFDKGLAAYQQQDYAAALAEFRVSADQGEVRSRFALGVMYDNGRGVPKDARQAFGWFQKAAEQGHASAQFNLGVRYANGQGVPKDDRQAVGWYQKAAEQGMPMRSTTWA